METKLADFIRDTSAGREADAILRKCVHCGFCTATCPTYQLLGDELDGPRGRIYQIKRVLEGEPATPIVREHLDRCLTCRSCETTCPSGVQYSRLLDIGRAEVAKQVPRSAMQRAVRGMLRYTLSRPKVFRTLLEIGRVARGVLPSRVAAKIPAVQEAGTWPSAQTHQRRMLALAGCVQPALTPLTNIATARVLDALGISLFEAPAAGCCGALSFHLDAEEAARDAARHNIDAWLPHLDEGVEAIVVTASGCSVQVKDYGHLLKDDPAYAAKAERVASLCRDVSEVIVAEEAALTQRLKSVPREAVAFHSPCTLQHGQKIRGVIESLLQAAGYSLTRVRDAHLCCGSAGTYSILQSALSMQLRENKLAALTEGKPACIATANVGCQTHLASGMRQGDTPVRHWIELIAAAL
ncbi:MAG TPA: glycolate oxidase subunit GlcF [Rhodocyclaceae bacterium]|nr:glycolate oxidase subunit GlcF [Rhodocyclaceae bacterium]